MAHAQLDPTEQDALVKQIGLTLLRAAPDEWQQLVVRYRAVGRYHEMTGELHTVDGEQHEWAVTPDVATLFARLRGGMYRDGRGTWFNARYQLDRPSSYNLDYDRDEPQWINPPPQQAYADELKIFPRSEDNVPDWLMRRLAGLAPQQPGPQFRIARIFDGMGAGGRPQIDRGELDEQTIELLLAYLDSAPVVLPGRGYDIDRLATDAQPTVPVAFHSDGIWIWPAAVNYYLRAYGVPPEPDLLEHIQAAQYTVPEVPDAARTAAASYLTQQQPGPGPAPPAPTPQGQPPQGQPEHGAAGPADGPARPPADAATTPGAEPPQVAPQPGDAPVPPRSAADEHPEADETAIAAMPPITDQPPAEEPARPEPADLAPGRPEPEIPGLGVPPVQGADDEDNALEVTRVDGSIPILGEDGLPLDEQAGSPAPGPEPAEPPTQAPGPDNAEQLHPGYGTDPAQAPAPPPSGMSYPGLPAPHAGFQDPGLDDPRRQASEPPDTAPSDTPVNAMPAVEQPDTEEPDAGPEFGQMRVGHGTQDIDGPAGPPFAEEPPLDGHEQVDTRPAFESALAASAPTFSEPDPPKDDHARSPKEPGQTGDPGQAGPSGEPGASGAPMPFAAAPPAAPGDVALPGRFDETSRHEREAPAVAQRPGAAEPPSDPLELLRYRLTELGVPESAYRIDDSGEHAWCLERTEAGWRVGWYDDDLTSPAVFGDVQDAAAFMLGKLLLAPQGRQPGDTASSGSAVPPAAPVAGGTAATAPEAGGAPEAVGMGTRPAGTAGERGTNGVPGGDPDDRSPARTTGEHSPLEHTPLADSPTADAGTRLQRFRTEIPPEISAAALAESQSSSDVDNRPRESEREQGGAEMAGNRSAPGRDSGEAFTAPEPGRPTAEAQNGIPNGMPAAAGSGQATASVGQRAAPHRRDAGSEQVASPAGTSGHTGSSGGRGTGQRAQRNPNSTSRWPIQPLPGEPPLTLFRGKQMTNLPAGSELDRFGDPDGNLTYADGTLFEHRSLVPEWVNRPYHVYRLRRPLQVLTGTAIPWFDQPGGGTAYLLPSSIEDLLADGALVELDPGEPPVGGF